jgi:hypothetical protein
MESYHTGYKFGGGPRNEARVPKFRPPLSPEVFPELREARLAAHRDEGAAHARCKAHNYHRRQETARRRVSGGTGRRASHPGQPLFDGKQLAAVLLVDGKQRAAVCRINPLWRLRCCALAVFCCGGAGARSLSQNFDPPLSPEVFPELRQARLAPSRGGAAHPHPARPAGAVRVPSAKCAPSSGEGLAAAQIRQRWCQRSSSPRRCEASWPSSSAAVAQVQTEP